MGNLNLSQAFAEYGAKLANHQWAVSAIADDGALIISCWAHYFKKVDGHLQYEDILSRWRANSAGNNLIRQHIEDAMKNGRTVRLVIATANDTAMVDSGNDASKVKKTFHTRPDMTGRISYFDGDKFVIDFQRKKS